jgi:succinoglycan biosynthesis protein ExoM
VATKDANTDVYGRNGRGDISRMSTPFQTLIAVPAGGNPADLERLLKALASDYGLREDVRLLVADNTADGSARMVFDACSISFGGRAHYVHEPRRGYSSVRNAVISNVGEVDAIAMIDDDEVPAPDWLDSLLAARERWGADVVAGPVISEFPPSVPAWYASSGVFDLEAPEFAEGGEMRWCASNNTLVLAKVLQRVPEGFDPKFDQTGGTDTNFFMRARLRGCKIVWTKTAVVHEFLPTSRLTRRWIFRRATRAGNSRAVIEFELAGGAKTRFMRAAKAIGLGAFGIGSALAAGLRRNRALGLRAMHRLGLAYGMALAFKSDQPWAP